MNQKKIYIVNYPIKAVMTKKQFDEWVSIEVDQALYRELSHLKSANRLTAILRSFTNILGLHSVDFNVSATSQEELDVFSMVLEMMSDKIKTTNTYTTEQFKFVPTYTIEAFSSGASVYQKYKIEVSIGYIGNLSELLSDVEQELAAASSSDVVKKQFLKTAQYETRILTLDETEE